MALKQTFNSLYAPDGSEYVTLTDGAGNLVGTNAGGAPSSSTSLSSSSGNVAAAVATATLAGAANKTTYISGFSFTSAGATAASVVNGTISGLLGGTQTYTLAVTAGATSANPVVSATFSPPLPASATNTAIVVSFPSLGAGNTNATVSAWGYQV